MVHIKKKKKKNFKKKARGGDCHIQRLLPLPSPTPEFTS